MSRTYIDVLFDSDSPEVDSDNPSFTLTPDVQNVIGSAVVWAAIPKTWNVVDRANAFFALRFDDELPAYYGGLEFPTGTYDSVSVLAAIQSAINASTISPVKKAGFSFSINSATNIFTISNSVVGFGMAFYSSSQSLASMLGFKSLTDGPGNEDDIFDWKQSVSGSYQIDPNVISPVTNYLSGSATVQLAGPSVISIRSGQLRAVARSHDYKFSTLLNIPSSALYGSNTLFMNPNPEPVYTSDTAIAQMELSLTAGTRTRYWSDKLKQYVKYLPLNGNGFQVVIRFYQRVGVQEVYRG